jgi:hypothetical protein
MAYFYTLTIAGNCDGFMTATKKPRITPRLFRVVNFNDCGNNPWKLKWGLILSPTIKPLQGLRWLPAKKQALL